MNDEAEFRSIARNNTFMAIPSLLALYYSLPVACQAGLEYLTWLVAGAIIGWCIALWTSAWALRFIHSRKP